MRVTDLALVVGLLAVAHHASAEEALDDAGESPRAAANGYLDGRFQYTHVHPSGLVPTADLPTISTLLEANVELRIPIAPPAFAYADLSFFIQAGALYYQDDGAGHVVRVPAHDVAALHPRAVPSELYVSYAPRPWLTLLAGRKRVLWGSGVGFNPTDLLNPPKDPTDPTLQRAGAWMFRAEAPFEKFTLSALAAPVVADDGLLATGRYLAAARAYALLANADLSLAYYFSNRYLGTDDFRDKSRFGVSASRYFFADWELHFEALLTLGTARRFGAPEAAGSAASAPTSSRALLDTVLPQSRLDSCAFLPRAVVGTRRSFADESQASLEYYFQADGYSQHEFTDFVRVVRAAKERGQSSALFSGMAETSRGLPQRFTFDPLRRHYLIASYSKPRLFEDWTATLTLILGLADLSGLLSPSVSFAPEQWLTLTAAAFVPIRSLPVGRSCAVTTNDGRCPSGESYSEFSLLPEDARLLVEARAFY